MLLLRQCGGRVLASRYFRYFGGYFGDGALNSHPRWGKLPQRLELSALLSN